MQFVQKYRLSSVFLFLYVLSQGEDKLQPGFLLVLSALWGHRIRLQCNLCCMSIRQRRPHKKLELYVQPAY